MPPVPVPPVPRLQAGASGAVPACLSSAGARRRCFRPARAGGARSRAVVLVGAGSGVFTMMIIAIVIHRPTSMVLTSPTGSADHQRLRFSSQ